jgi:hypothetical protein
VVDVVDNLMAGEAAPELLLHHVPVLEDLAALVVVPHHDASIALVVEPPTTKPLRRPRNSL